MEARLHARFCLWARSLYVPPVERKGEKISGVRNVRKPRAGRRGVLHVLVFAQAERATASLRRVGDETVAAVFAPVAFKCITHTDLLTDRLCRGVRRDCVRVHNSLF